MAGLEALAEELRLTDHDLLLVGDGSGSVYHRPTGWACVAYDRLKPQVTVHAGALTCGTSNFAELAPYVQALWYHHQDHGQPTQADTDVALVSDSEVVVRCGNRQYSRNANACLWAAIEWFERCGYRLTWRHVRRASIDWNVWADRIAGYLRSLVETEENALMGRPAPGAGAMRP
jgi:ribonuclease HI